MILVDSSVWVEHLRKGNRGLVSLLEEDLVLCHPFVLGELALGRMKNRDRILSHMAALPFARSASDREVMHLVLSKKLQGLGVGWVDVHLLASALRSHCQLLTRDKALGSLARKLDLDP